SPFYPVEPYYPGPSECKIEQVNLLYRHGARHPTLGAGARMASTLEKLLSASSLSPRLRFVESYEWQFNAGDLLPYGAKEGYIAGQIAFERYGALLGTGATFSSTPFLRVSLSQRVVDTATNWTLGFAAAGNFSTNIYSPVLIPESRTVNNTLDDKNCPNRDESISDARQAQFLATFAPTITAALNAEAPGSDLDDTDVVNLYFLCAFDSLLREGLSPFCLLFDTSTWKDLETYQDVGKFYLTGPGNPLGPVQGVGYVSELIARLTSQPVRNTTNINRPLDASPDTFPLDRKIYVDFSHDNQVVPIYAALGLYNNSTRTNFKASEVVPFAGRLAVEKYSCPSGSPTSISSRSKRAWKQYVRFVSNDRVMKSTCNEANTLASSNGTMCELEAFIDTLDYVTGANGNDEAEREWEKCVAQPTDS
ncbi:acid phosphatase, partial [Clavulina sp. PMI_390]